MAQSYEQFGKYLLLEKIATGGMAEIYLARSTAANGLNKFFAIKRILPQYSNNSEFVAMFKEEAKVAINLNHSNVISIFDFGIEDGQFYLVMDFCEGRNLRQIINELKKVNKSFSIDQTLFLIKEAAAGLDHAHRCTDSTSGRPLNITHRDMSPQNIMVSFDGEVKVIDFGIAKAETEAEETKTGTLKGKFNYMSPEQAEGQPIDPRTDVFALGIVLWELLANDRLFTGSNEAAILRKVRECQVPPIRKINPMVPPELERIVMKSLAKDRNVRYQTAANLHRDLNRFLNMQYPDFSAHDFSQFIKESFKTAYQEGRDKLLVYAKYVIPTPVAVAPPPEIPKIPVVNQTSETKTNNEINIPQVPAGFSIEENIKIKLNDLLLTTPSSSKNSGAGGTNINPRMNTNITQQSKYLSNTKVSKISASQKSSDFGDVFLKSIIVLMLSFGCWWGYYHYFSKISIFPRPITTNPPIKPIVIDPASTAKIKVSISSSPDNAQVFINGQLDPNRTPAVINVTANKETEIIIRKDGYLDYRIMRSFSETSQLFATMQASFATGYLNIEVIDSNSFTKISINEKELLERPPIVKYPVVAGKETLITAYNPITKLTDKVMITLKPNEIMNVKLILERTQRKKKK